MIFIWAPYDSKTAKALGEQLGKGGHRVKTIHENLSIGPHDLIVNWGSKSCPKGPYVLNQHVISNKFKEIKMLYVEGVPVPEISFKPREGFLGRKSDHVDGYDLLEKAKGDYYVEFVETIDEYRVHSWKGKTLLLEKREKAKADAHPWIRACEAGWNLYAETFDHGAAFLVPLRAVAHQAVKTLGYDFGAVDIARRKGGGLVVFEVNSAPGLEGYELTTYVNAINQVYKEIQV